MRYKLDSLGYVRAVSFGCYLDNCTEYTGAIPSGYKSLDDWATNACIQAYYIDQKGDLVLDSYRKNELEEIQAQEAINNSPVLRKDIFEVEETIYDQYVRKTETGKVIALDDIKIIPPKVKITGIQPGVDKITLYTQGKNMMQCDAVSCNTCGVTFTKNMVGSLSILGTATENIEYVIADGKGETLFALKANTDYFLNLGGLQCELRYFDGETTSQQYVGTSGLINVPENIEVTQVVIKFHSGEPINTTFFPQLERGNRFTSYKEYKCKTLEIELAEIELDLVLPRNDLYAKDTLYPGTFSETIDYINIENGKIDVSIGDNVKTLGNGNLGLFSDYSTIYALEDVMLRVEYSDNEIDVESLEFLQGKSTTTNQFKILKDGSIEAHNAFLSGRIEADSGYFKGEVSWENIIEKDGVATKEYVEEQGYQNALQVTKITRDTVTTSFVNALNVTAGFVMAENILGTTISGKTLYGSTITGSTINGGTIMGGTISGGTIMGARLSGVTGDFSGKISASSGDIGGFSINQTSIYNEYGVYLGIDGLKFGSLASISASGKAVFGDVSIKGVGSINFSSGTSGMTLNHDGIKFSSASLNTEITSDKVQVYKTYMDKDGLHIAGTSTYYTDIDVHKISFGGSSYDSATIEKGGKEMISFSNGRTVICSDQAVLGSPNKKIGFFGSTGATEQTVSTISSTSSATASTVATKLNELIKALQAYNLV